MPRSTTTRRVCVLSMFRVACFAVFVAMASSASAQPAVAGGSGFSLILKDDGTVWAGLTVTPRGKAPGIRSIQAQGVRAVRPHRKRV